MSPASRRLPPDEFLDLFDEAIGPTPLVGAESLSHARGLPDLRLKLEGANGTGSAKDRLARAAVHDALLRGCELITLASCGNMALAVANAAQMAGLQAKVFLQAVHLPETVEEIRSYGAQVEIVSGDYEFAVARSRAICGDEVYDANPGGEHADTHIGGYEAIAAEILSDLDGKAPRYVAVPVGNGTIIAGVHRGFLRSLGEGRAGEMPHIVGGSVAGQNAIVHSIELGRESYADIPSTQMHVTETAAPLATWQALDGPTAFEAIMESGGFAMAFADSDLEDAAKELQEREGIVEAVPAATAGLLALLESRRVSRLGDAERASLETGDVVVVLTSGVLTRQDA
jgi:threonine synthase